MKSELSCLYGVGKETALAKKGRHTRFEQARDATKRSRRAAWPVWGVYSPAESDEPRFRRVPPTVERNSASQQSAGDGLATRWILPPSAQSRAVKVQSRYHTWQPLGRILTPHPIRTNQPGATDRNGTLPWSWVLLKEPAALDGASWEKLTFLFFLHLRQSLVHGLALPPDSWYGPFQWRALHTGL